MITDLVAAAESQRIQAQASLDAETQGALGQFFTPARAAKLLVSMLHLRGASDHLRVLDAGAGSGILSAAFASRVLRETRDTSLHVVAVEQDDHLLPFLCETLDICKAAADGRFTYELIDADYIMASTGLEADSRLTSFDVAIQNPPYAKLSTSSAHRKALKAFGVDVPNLYAAFLALTTASLNPGGQVVAITPRSFFNGPYFAAFRSFLLDRIAIQRVHVFESRSTVFSETGVLQENVIFAGTCGAPREAVALSISVGHNDDVTERLAAYDEVVHPGDPHRFIRLATSEEDTKIAEEMLSLPCTLEDLGAKVSTGRVVDFRVRDALCVEPAEGARPLVYSGNFKDGGFLWPRGDIGKPQWFAPDGTPDAALLLPEGWYCVVKRFTAKEEPRRVVASLWSPLAIPGEVAFENHLNVFHINGHGLDEQLARGLTIWLNSSFVDRFFRTFSGHTQVNASDIKSLRFPALPVIRRLGTFAVPGDQLTTDALVNEEARVAA